MSIFQIHQQKHHILVMSIFQIHQKNIIFWWCRFSKSIKKTSYFGDVDFPNPSKNIIFWWCRFSKSINKNIICWWCRFSKSIKKTSYFGDVDFPNPSTKTSYFGDVDFPNPSKKHHILVMSIFQIHQQKHHMLVMSIFQIHQKNIIFWWCRFSKSIKKTSYFGDVDFPNPSKKHHILVMSIFQIHQQKHHMLVMSIFQIHPKNIIFWWCRFSKSIKKTSYFGDVDFPNPSKKHHILVISITMFQMKFPSFRVAFLTESQVWGRSLRLLGLRCPGTWLLSTKNPWIFQWNLSTIRNY